MRCGGGCCQKKNYNSDKPFSKRIPQIILVFFVVWLIGFGFIAQTFNQPKKPQNRRRNKKRGYKEPSFFEKLSNGLRQGDLLIWGLVIFFIFSVVLLVIRIISMQIKKTEMFIQDKWEEAMAEQEKRYNERMRNYDDSFNFDDDEGPRIRELTTEEEEAQWRRLMEQERREREQQMAEIEEEKKKTK